MTRSTVDHILPGGIRMAWFLIRAHVFSGGEICLIYPHSRYIPDNLYDLHDLRQVMFYRVESV